MQIKLDTIIRHLTFIHIHQNILNQVRSLGGCFIGKQVDWYLGILYRQMQIKNSTRVTQWLLCVQLKKMEFHAVLFSFECSWSHRAKPSWSYLDHHLKLKLSPHPSRRRQWHPTPVLLPGKSHRRRSLVGCNPWSC